MFWTTRELCVSLYEEVGSGPGPMAKALPHNRDQAWKQPERWVGTKKKKKNLHLERKYLQIYIIFLIIIFAWTFLLLCPVFWLLQNNNKIMIKNNVENKAFLGSCFSLAPFLECSTPMWGVILSVSPTPATTHHPPPTNSYQQSDSSLLRFSLCLRAWH